MTVTQRALSLDANPLSVKVARAWAHDALVAVGRPDLVENAELGITELVTNAILHAGGDVHIRLRGTVDRPRLEVHDASLVAPRVIETDGDATDPVTFGRGLTLVGMVSQRWGVDIDRDTGGKTVWFEPGPEVRDHPGRFTRFEHLVGALDEVDRSSYLDLRLLRMPPALFVDLRRHHAELAREMRLLALSSDRDHPLAVRFTEIVERADQDRRLVAGIDGLETAIAEAAPQVDLAYLVPPRAPATMAAYLGLLEEIYAHYAHQHLLALTPPPTLLRLQRWYLQEFVRQGRGEDPQPWDGPTRRDQP